MENTLFDLPEIKKIKSQVRCCDCDNHERWECGGSIIWYCGVLKSNRTENGKLKIKAYKFINCDSFKSIKH
jgi:hypothetical protein